MNLTISLYSETQQYQDYCNVKEKDHIKININSKKKEMFKKEIVIIIIIIILVWQKPESVGAIQQKINLLLPYHY